ncbi:MAG: hypothetical protein WCP09_01370 [Candidatus Taylorbacteria bacterium]
MSNKIVKISYIDAHYSYGNNTKPPVGRIVSYGRILERNNEYIDLEQSWTEHPKATVFGIVIPIGVIRGMNKKPQSIIRDICHEGDSVAVYWNDIFQYDDDYTGKHKLTPMLTEGVLFRETSSNILIDNPITLNLIDSINHPDKTPKKYYIPKAMITEIRLIKQK